MLGRGRIEPLSGGRVKTHRELLVEFQRVAIPGSQADEVMQHISEQLHTELVRYNWGVLPTGWSRSELPVAGTAFGNLDATRMAFAESGIVRSSREPRKDCGGE